MTSADISDINDTAAAKTPAKQKAKPLTPHNPNDANSEHLTITIHPGAESDGTAPVKLGVNGKAYLIPRNIPVQLPSEAVQVLKDTCYTEYREVGGEQQPFSRQRYSFSIN